MLEDELSTSDLLEQWREATRAAQLAERLATLAQESVERSDRDASASKEIARIAERTARHAEATARIAREAADRAMAFAKENRSGYLANAEAAVEVTRDGETAARDRYHAAEEVATERGRRA